MPMLITRIVLIPGVRPRSKRDTKLWLTPDLAATWRCVRPA